MASPAEQVRACVADIKKAEWVAIDLEFSGLFTEKPRSSHRSLKEYFSHCVESVTTFSCLQIGFCCSINGSYTVHEFYCAPRQQFTLDLNSLRFLRRHHFDVNEFVDKCMWCDPVGQSRTGGITEVIEALIERKCAIVFHHGLFDVLHIASAFLGDIEDMGLDDFLALWKEKVPNPVFDTRYLAQEGKLTVLRHAGGLGLQDLHRSLTKNNGPKSDAHASGKDALMTAELFAQEIDRYMEHARSKSKKRQRDEVSFFESPLADRFRNFIAVGAVEPGFIKLTD